MRNAQLKPGYNVQIAVDSEYIVATDIFQDRNDVWTLVPFLKTLEERLNYRYPSVTADSGYEIEEGYSFLREQGQTSSPCFCPEAKKQKWICIGCDRIRMRKLHRVSVSGKVYEISES